MLILDPSIFSKLKSKFIKFLLDREVDKYISSIEIFKIIEKRMDNYISIRFLATRHRNIEN